MKKTIVILSTISMTFILISSCMAEFRFDKTSFNYWAKETVWENKGYDLLYNQFQCLANEPVNDLSPCNYFVSKAYESIFDIRDFKTTTGHMLANEIVDYLISSPSTWIEIGYAHSQSVLTEAQRIANEGFPTLAIRPGTAHGHIALILPGELQYSGSWSLKVPNSASFFYRVPQKSYVGKKLSFAWNKHDSNDVKIYYRIK